MSATAPRVWYFVREFDRGRDFYKRLLGFDETFVDWQDKWSKLERGGMRIALSEGEPIEAGVAMVDVDDVKDCAERLRAEGVEVGVVLELAGQMRIVDVFDPDGNRVQLAQHFEQMIRKGSHADVPFMRSMLAHAYGWRVNARDTEIPLTRYVDNWGREGDVALISTETGHRVGAAWFRVFKAAEPGYGFVDEQTPELTISIVPSRRRHGVGQELLDALLEKAREAGHTAVSLSVESDSPAVAFYERNGFERTGEAAGGIVMRRAL